ncbi:hypothetical protein [Vogesella indigofera]|uniref:hypothetical protein n=1 Tax=Vogesella indigofera TaxID=45465 RepID=UPI00234E5D6B|nr:hypothetical protein [Vogesella indigofera]MDC7697176.1 hypothetical protein [Vogesella indigofera]
MKKSEDAIDVSNYCVCFIDLLGQRVALKGQGLLPVFKNENEQNKFLEVVKNSVGDIYWLQIKAMEFLEPSNSNPSFLSEMTTGQKLLYDEMKKARLHQQRWSDGLVLYHSLADEYFKCPMNAVMEIFHLAGALCFLGVASNKPIRGAIEVGWGVELHSNELYGAVIANSYELESTVAQYPRIVIGEATIKYLQSHIDEPIDIDNKFAVYNKTLAEMCINLTAVDQDGYRVLNYLGKQFKENVFQEESASLFKAAYANICSQYEEHKRTCNSKLAMRYTWLRDYFNQHKKMHI